MMSRNTDEPPSRPVLEIAIQTILFKNKARLSSLADNNAFMQLEDISKQITMKAIVLQQITDAVVRELDDHHPHVTQREDVTR